MESFKFGEQEAFGPESPPADAPELPLAVGAQGAAHSRAERHEEALRWRERALTLTPGDAALLLWAGGAESAAGWLARVLTYIGRAARLSPMSLGFTTAPASLP